MNAALQRLLEAAPDFGVTNVVVEDPEIRLTLPVPRADGRTPAYDLTVKAAGQRVSVRETVPKMLPAFCPERHVNNDGTFCLAWSEVDPLVIMTRTEAERWWGVVLQFLRLQERAERRRRWPDRRVWAHGSAAGHQRQASEHALALGLADDFSAGRLSVARRVLSPQGPSLRVSCAGKPLYAVWENQKRVVNLRRACVCPEGCRRGGAVIRNCGHHASEAVALAIELVNIDKAERKFWASYQGKSCCGSMDECPLAAA